MVVFVVGARVRLSLRFYKLFTKYVYELHLGEEGFTISVAEVREFSPCVQALLNIGVTVLGITIHREAQELGLWGSMAGAVSEECV